MKNNTGQHLWQKAKNLIPGGNHLLSKRPEWFLPGKWPAYYSRAKGATIWDLDNVAYTDMSISGVSSCPLGFADDDVDGAVRDAISKGNMSTLNVPEEVDLAETLIELNPWAEMVRYARTGGESMAVAARIVRASTGREKILFCGYHGWHDWYISANLGNSKALDGQLLNGIKPTGVPRGLHQTMIPFEYNNLNDFETKFDEHKGQLAAVIMEPVRTGWPKNGFLERIRSLTRSENVPLVFDEITSGFRMTVGGIHQLLKIEPDVAVYAKGISNGYPMAAIVGRREIMEAAQNSFISSTYWTDRIGPTAALANIKKYRENNVPEKLIHIGESVKTIWKKISDEFDVPISIAGISSLGFWQCQVENEEILHTLIAEKMLGKRFLTGRTFSANYSHSDEDVSRYGEALHQVFSKLVPHVKEKSLTSIFTGEVIHRGFQRLN